VGKKTSMKIYGAIKWNKIFDEIVGEKFSLSSLQLLDYFLPVTL